MARAMDQLMKRLLDHMKETGLDPEDTESSSRAVEVYTSLLAYGETFL